MHALCRSCEVQQETSELAQHERAHGDMADLPLHPSVAQPLSPPAGDEDLNVTVGYRIGVAGEENKLRPGQGNEEGNEVLASATSASTPLNVQGEHFQSALDWHFNSPFPAEKELFLRLAFERTITPSHCPSPIFSPLWRRKEETGVWESKERGCHQAQASAINHRWGVRRWGLESGWVQQGPKLLVETLRSFHVYSNIINVMGKNYFPSFLMNNLYPEHSFPCCVPPCLL